VTYEELVKEAEKLGAKVSVRTLKRFVSKGLLPSPERSHGGRGVGYVVSFPKDVIGDVMANYYFLQNREATYKELSIVRERALKEEKKDLSFSFFAKEYTKTQNRDKDVFLVGSYILERINALEGIKRDVMSTLIYEIDLKTKNKGVKKRIDGEETDVFYAMVGIKREDYINQEVRVKRFIDITRQTAPGVFSQGVLSRLVYFRLKN